MYGAVADTRRQATAERSGVPAAPASGGSTS